MDAILLCMKKRGIRFFNKVRFPNTSVKRFHTKASFLDLLHAREGHFDNILLMAHGTSNAILTTTRDVQRPYTVYISAEEATAFKNDFVFAISCCTANEFGQRCVKEGAIAYLGYQVDIVSLFCSSRREHSSVPKRVIAIVETIMKRVFIESLSSAYEEFLTNPISIQVLRERFSFLLEKGIAQLSNMSTEQVYKQYGIRPKERDFKEYIVEIVLCALSNLDDIQPKLICIGDINYISSSYVEYRHRDGMAAPNIAGELEENYAFNSIEHTEYKQHLRAIVDSLKGKGAEPRWTTLPH